MGFTADPYDILKILPTADSSEISSAYHSLARQLHPDKNNAPNAKDDFQQLNQAYQVLSDPVERSKLDNQRAAKERELQKLQQAREIQLKYQQQLIEQKARERAFQFQEQQQKLQQQKLAREQAMRKQMAAQNETNQNPREINQEIIYDPHHDATAKWLLEQFGIQTNDLGNNSNLCVDSVKKRAKSPCRLTPVRNGTSIPSRSTSPQPQPQGVNQGAYIQINAQPRTNTPHSMNNMHNTAHSMNNMHNTAHSMNNMHNTAPGMNNMHNTAHSMNNMHNTAHSMNNMHNINTMHNKNSMHNMNNTNSMNRTNSVKFQQRSQGNVFNQQIPSNAYNQQIPSQGSGQNGYQHIRVDSINRRPRPLPKTPPDVKLREQSRSSSMVFDLSMLEAQLLDGVCNSPEPRTMQKDKLNVCPPQVQQNPKVMLIKVVSNPLLH